MNTLSPFRENIITLYRDKGRKWLESLPQRTVALAKKWELGDLVLATDLTYHAVYFSSSRPCVLKVGLDQEGLDREVLALKHFNGQGCVLLVEECRKEGGLLIQRVQPGISLKTFFAHDDLEAVKVAVTVMQQLHQKLYAPPGASNSECFPALHEWLKVLNQPLPLPLDLLWPAKMVAKKLLATSSSQAVLHGDLHHDNILLHQGGEGKMGWIAIDPKGVRGEIAFETTSFIRNPLPQLLDNPKIVDIIDARINCFARLLNIESVILYQWNFVAAVLCACWAVEDRQDPTRFLSIATILKHRII
jgi:streptomycin 6-kinase